MNSTIAAMPSPLPSVSYPQAARSISHVSMQIAKVVHYEKSAIPEGEYSAFAVPPGVSYRATNWFSNSILSFKILWYSIQISESDCK
ncbi:exported hypothetical protein [uncultured Eubacteriales bacterium]|uniref:Uncharacterized protein n=1 Tax=uncultured Eubacteriales bacterium TaxID=172733 RepID=A0A212KGJ9_9FIRM|nr:exported hypothetical protein [uncultured Eubacteriales bacterium]